MLLELATIDYSTVFPVQIAERSAGHRQQY